jgi:hypothetical protein
MEIQTRILKKTSRNSRYLIDSSVPAVFRQVDRLRCFNKRLRLAFWMAGLVAIHQRENAFRDKYERYLSATPFDADRKRKALTAVAAKMARVAYAVVKHGSDYQCFYEQRIPSGSIPLARAVEASSTS